MSSSIAIQFRREKPVQSSRIPRSSLPRRLCAFNGTKSTEKRFASTFPPIRGWLRTDTEIFSFLFRLENFRDSLLPFPTGLPARDAFLRATSSDLATKKKRFFLLFKMHPESSRIQAPKRSGMRRPHCQQQMRKCVTKVAVCGCIFETLSLRSQFYANPNQSELMKYANRQPAQREGSRTCRPAHLQFR